TIRGDGFPSGIGYASHHLPGALQAALGCRGQVHVPGVRTGGGEGELCATAASRLRASGTTSQWTDGRRRCFASERCKGDAARRASSAEWHGVCVCAQYYPPEHLSDSAAVALTEPLRTTFQKQSPAAKTERKVPRLGRGWLARPSLGTTGGKVSAVDVEGGDVGLVALVAQGLGGGGTKRLLVGVLGREQWRRMTSSPVTMRSSQLDLPGSQESSTRSARMSASEVPSLRD